MLEMASLITYCERVRENLRDFSMQEKQFALEALNITVVWHPDKPLESLLTLGIVRQGTLQALLDID